MLEDGQEAQGRQLVGPFFAEAGRVDEMPMFSPSKLESCSAAFPSSSSSSSSPSSSPVLISSPQHPKKLPVTLLLPPPTPPSPPSLHFYRSTILFFKLPLTSTLQVHVSPCSCALDSLLAPMAFGEEGGGGGGEGEESHEITIVDADGCEWAVPSQPTSSSSSNSSSSSPSSPPSSPLTSLPLTIHFPTHASLDYWLCEISSSTAHPIVVPMSPNPVLFKQAKQAKRRPFDSSAADLAGESYDDFAVATGAGSPSLARYTPPRPRSLHLISSSSASPFALRSTSTIQDFQNRCLDTATSPTKPPAYLSPRRRRGDWKGDWKDTKFCQVCNVVFGLVNR